MTDTLPHIQKKYEAMLMSLPWYKRLEMASGMFESGKALMQIGLPKGLSEKEKKLEMFKRFYQHDFAPEKFEMWLKMYKDYLDTTE
jgi:hypothetical protein